MKLNKEKFKLYRLRSGYTQEELAAKFGISKQAVQRWESGASNPRKSLLPTLANLFNCLQSDFCDIESEEEEETLRAIITKAKSLNLTERNQVLQYLTKNY
ncbi:helix-turn-helix transcriptional regulator [Lentisphaerota bacterium WC36G]|nr:helix-turn-helix domain-containing protein [Lentisphaerae bacterium WC36]